MHKLKLTFFLLFIAAAVPWLASAATPASTNTPASPKSSLKDADLFPDTVVARGKGFEIKRSQVDAEALPQVMQYVTAGRPLSPEQRLLLDQKILEHLIDIRLLQAKATEADRATGYTQVDLQIESFKAQLDTQEKMDRQLKVWGVTNLDQVRAKLREDAVATAVLSRELTVNVGGDDIKKEFDNSKSRFEQPEMVRVSQILFLTHDLMTRAELPQADKDKKRKLAEDVLKRARAGEDFTNLAKQYSEAPSVNDKGREVMLSRQMTASMPEFETAVFNLQTNQISDLVTTMYGFHIVKVFKRYAARQADLNDDILINPTEGYFVVKKYWTEPVDTTWKTETPAAVIRRALEAQQRSKEAPVYLAKLSKEAGVEILDESLKPRDDLAPLQGRPPMTPPSPAPGSK